MRPSVRYLSLLGASLLLVLSCGEEKLSEPGLDYGPEDAPVAAKDDSATSPASMARLTIGQPIYTTFTATGRWRAFKLTAVAGAKLDVFVDGKSGLDTVAFVYNVSATTGRPYGRPIASNDDTQVAGWSSNTASSSIAAFVPRYSRDYAVVVTTYHQAGRGTAQVVVRGATTSTPAAFFVTSSPGRSVTIDGTHGEALTVSPAANALVGALKEGPAPYAAAYRFAPADLAQALATTAAAQPLLGAAFSDSLGTMSEYVKGPEISVASIDAHLGGAAIDSFLHDVIGTLDPSLGTRAAFGSIAAAMIRDGATHAFQTHYDNGDDMSYDGIIVANTATGDVRIVGFRNDP